MADWIDLSIALDKLAEYRDKLSQSEAEKFGDPRKQMLARLRLGEVPARATQWTHRKWRGQDLLIDEREIDYLIPETFWHLGFIDGPFLPPGSDAEEQFGAQWKAGSFVRHLRSNDGRSEFWQVQGVEVEQRLLAVTIPDTVAVNVEADPSTPMRVSEAKLRRWFKHHRTQVPERELTIVKVWGAAKAHFAPKKFVTRKQIEDLLGEILGPRKSGRKRRVKSTTN